MAIDIPIIQRLVQLLLVPDEHIVNSIMEFFYLFTRGSIDAGQRLVTCVRFNVVNLFVKFLYWKGLNESSHNSVSAVKTEGKVGFRPNLDPRAMDHFHAAMW